MSKALFWGCVAFGAGVAWGVPKLVKHLLQSKPEQHSAGPPTTRWEDAKQRVEMRKEREKLLHLPSDEAISGDAIDDKHAS